MMGSVKTARLTHVFLGLIFCLNGVYNVAHSNFGWLGLSLGIIMFVLGIYTIIIAFTAFSKHSGFAPKVKVGPDFAEFKTGFFTSPVRIPWKEVRSVTLGKYQVHFLLKNGERSFFYRTSPEQSIAIKRSIREMAEDHHIEVVHD